MSSIRSIKLIKHSFPALLFTIICISLPFTACKGRTILAPKEDLETDFEARPIDGKEASIIGYKGGQWEVAIPSKIQGIPVTVIEKNAFLKKTLVKVTIPNSVTKIGQWAFAGNQLTSVTFASTSMINGTSFSADYSDDRQRLIREGYDSSFFDSVKSDGRAGTYTRPNVNSKTWTRQ
jgi:hypothetical protein